MENNTTNQNPLGKKIRHSPKYNPKHLFPVSRKETRKAIGIEKKIPFSGVDIWNAYEVSWLNSNGKPRVAVAEIRFPLSTKNIIESKSLKLYLHSIIQTKFHSTEAVLSAMEKDLSSVASGDVSVALTSPSKFQTVKIISPSGVCIDDLDIKIDQYLPTPDFLIVGEETVNEKLFSNLLLTNCPITGQPDWATIVIEYSGKKIDQAGLLRYIVSFRKHACFHETCVEQIFIDIAGRCNPDKLSVYARFTRRGGLDINPYRSNFDIHPENLRFARQ
jgi:7-cyano-7-deazaguanine reductase